MLNAPIVEADLQVRLHLGRLPAPQCGVTHSFCWKLCWKGPAARAIAPRSRAI